MCYCDHEGLPQFQQTKTRRARKSHRCGECHRTIKPGENYEHVTSKYDGSITTNKTCPHCVSVRETMLKFTGCKCFEFGGLHEGVTYALQELGFKSGWFALGRAVVAAKRAAA